MEIDYKQLMKMVKDGTHQIEMMEKFRFKASTQLKVALQMQPWKKGCYLNLPVGAPAPVMKSST